MFTTVGRITPTFLFAQVHAGRDVFVHQDHPNVEIGAVQRFDHLDIGELQEGDRGRKGLNVIWREQPEPLTYSDEVMNIKFDRGFGFARDALQREAFFNTRDFLDYDAATQASPQFRRLIFGEQVTGLFYQTGKGTCLVNVEAPRLRALQR